MLLRVESRVLYASVIDKRDIGAYISEEFGLRKVFKMGALKRGYPIDNRASRHEEIWVHNCVTSKSGDPVFIRRVLTVLFSIELHNGMAQYILYTQCSSN